MVAYGYDLAGVYLSDPRFRHLSLLCLERFHVDVERPGRHGSGGFAVLDCPSGKRVQRVVTVRSRAFPLGSGGKDLGHVIAAGPRARGRSGLRRPLPRSTTLVSYRSSQAAAATFLSPSRFPIIRTTCSGRADQGTDRSGRLSPRIGAEIEPRIGR